MNNRYQRRRAAKLTDFRAAGTLEILDPSRLVAKAEADPAFRRSVLQWIDAIPARRPLCVTCEALFRPDHMPALWHLIKPPHGPVLLAGSCGDCAARFPNDHALMGAVIANYGRATGARLRMADAAHLHATGGRA
jgi:hypothetical protein